MPVGLAAMIVVARAAMTSDVTAELATPLVVVGAVAGLVLGASALRPPRLDRWAARRGAGVFAVFAAPVVLSGSATFAGYTILGDTAVHFVLVDRIASHGTTWPVCRRRPTARRSRRTSAAAIRSAPTPRSPPCGRSPSSTSPGCSSPSSPSSRRRSRSRSSGCCAASSRRRWRRAAVAAARRPAGAGLRVRDAGQRQGARDALARAAAHRARGGLARAGREADALPAVPPAAAGGGQRRRRRRDRRRGGGVARRRAARGAVPGRRAARPRDWRRTAAVALGFAALLAALAADAARPRRLPRRDTQRWSPRRRSSATCWGRSTCARCSGSGSTGDYRCCRAAGAGHRQAARSRTC